MEIFYLYGARGINLPRLSRDGLGRLGIKRGVGLVGVRDGQTFAGRFERLPMFIGGTNGL